MRIRSEKGAVVVPLRVNWRKQQLESDAVGRNFWNVLHGCAEVDAERTAVIVCDMWDMHWSRSAAARVMELVPRMDTCLRAARLRGVHIIHAPSDTMDAYADHPGRIRMLEVPKTEPSTVCHVERPPLPIDDSDGGADAPEDPDIVDTKKWSCQHPGLFIDESRDVISDDGREIYSYVVDVGVEQVFMMGVHTNMCILNRSFGIRQLVEWGVPVALVRDLTDSMYNPALAPYVSHDAGTKLVVEYIEKFYCPTILSEDLM